MNDVQIFLKKDEIAKRIYETECRICPGRLRREECHQGDGIVTYKTVEFTKKEIREGTCCLTKSKYYERN